MAAIIFAYVLLSLSLLASSGISHYNCDDVKLPFNEYCLYGP